MKKLLLIAILAGLSAPLQAQKFKKTPERRLTTAEADAHLRFLASDALLGRKTGEQSNVVAAQYIAEQFRLLGVKPANGDSFFQQVPMEMVTPTKSGWIIAGNDTLRPSADFVVMTGRAMGISNAEVVHVGYGWVDEASGYDDYQGLNVKNKVVIAQVGTPESTTPQEVFSALRKKRKLAADHGAVAFIEIFNLTMPWQNVVNYFGKASLRLKDENTDNAREMPHIWVNANAGRSLAKSTITQLNLMIGSKTTENVATYNVAGIIAGSDPSLKNEYIVLSAHFDHIGHGSMAGAVTAEDTIFNGARDNAFGTTAVLLAAKAFAEKPAKRSVLLLAYTGEEVGLLGSEYYAQHPLVPLNKSIYNLNCDGAGYNDTTKVTVIGLNRTSAEEHIKNGAAVVGLTAIDDPAPEQNLFDRSDNVRLAAKGIPAPTYAPGMTAFDDEIFQYYHRVTDNPDTVSPNYLLKYCQSFTYAARLIANDPKQPKWVSGDKYEAAYNILYGVK